MTRMLVLVLAGLFNGAITGLTGSNAMAAILSILLVAGYKVHEVLGLCLVTQIFTLTAALVPAARAEGLPGAATAALCVPAAAFAYLGGSTGLRVPGPVLTGAIATALAAMGIALLRKRSAPMDAEAERVVHAGARTYALVGLTGAVMGFGVGLFGGGNIFVTQALHRLLGFRFRRALAMALALGLVAAMLGAAPYVLAGRVDLATAPAVVVPALVMARVMGGVATRLPPRRVQQGQGVYVLAMAIVITARQLL
jgi:uncharacterized protein